MNAKRKNCLKMCNIPTIETTDDTQGTSPDRKRQDRLKAEDAIKQKDEYCLMQLLQDKNLYKAKSEFGVDLLERTIQENWEDGMIHMLGPASDEINYGHRLKQALLLGIRYDNIRIVRKCLELKPSIWEQTAAVTHSTGTISRASASENLEEQILLEESTFDMRTSPICLAIILQRHDIVCLLLEKGCSELHPLSDVGMDGCELMKQTKGCIVCATTSLVKEGSLVLEDSHRILSTYKALCSPLFILYSKVKDPVMELFKLSGNLRVLTQRDPAFSKEYESLDRQCQLVAVELLDLCRTENEVETLLSRTYATADQLQLPEGINHPVVLMALYYRQKEFIAHPHCQHVLLKSWYEGLPTWLDVTYTSRLKVYLTSAFLCLLVPVFCILYILHISHKVNRVMRVAAVRFVTDTVSYATFMVILLAQVLMKEYQEETLLGDMPSPLYWCMVLFVVGMFARAARAIFRQRDFMCSCRSTITSGLLPQGHAYDFIFLSVFLISFVLLWIELILVSTGVHKNVPRYEWGPYNMRLIAEALESIGCVMACVRICFLFQFNHSLGTLIISLRSMIPHTVRFLLVFIIVLSAFGLALAGLYFPYSHYADQNETRTRFFGFDDTFKTLFWALFGLGDVDDPDLDNNRTYTDWSNKQKTNTSVTCMLLMLSQSLLTCVVKDPTSNVSLVDKTENFITCPILANSSNPLSCDSTGSNFIDILCNAGNLDAIESSVDAHLSMRCNCLMEGPMEMEGPHHRVTELVGYTLFGFYNVLAVIILLNMFIATTANMYSRIEGNSDQEWKFGRARMCMEYFFRVGTLPSPLNIIGTPLHIASKAARRACCRCCVYCGEVDEDGRRTDRKQLEDNHKKLVQNLATRFWYRRYKPRSSNTNEQQADNYNSTWNKLHGVNDNRCASILSFSRHMTSVRRVDTPIVEEE